MLLRNFIRFSSDLVTLLHNILGISFLDGGAENAGLENDGPKTACITYAAVLVPTDCSK